MKIVMLRSVVARRKPRTAGEVTELSNREAMQLIADGAALPYVAPIIESAVIAPAETAVLPRPRKRSKPCS